MTGLLLVTGMILLAPGFHKTYCMVYHVTFLRRSTNISEEHRVGELHYQGANSTPNVTNEVDCTWKPEGNTNITKLVPNGTCLGLIPNGVGISTYGVKVESSDDFILHVYQSDPTGTLADGYLAIPDEHLGREYYVATYCSLGGFCQFAVTGTVDKTQVNIVFPLEVSPATLTCSGVPLPVNAPPGEPIQFLLNENQVLHIESNESKTDLSGTYIASDHEVAVFVGARDVPSASGETAYMIEQIPPINKWGTDFVVAPNYLNDAGDIIKIVTQSEETIVHILGFSPFTISNPGESVERRIGWEMHSSIHASKPILIVQIMSLNLYNDTTSVTGSPAMVLVPHGKQWTDSEVYSDCLQKAENQSILTIVAENWAHIDGFTLEYVNGTDYSVLRIGPMSPESEGSLLHGVNHSTYGYCGGKSAVLLDVNWDWENEDCIPTAPVPGDHVDNDCDGKIDEDNCTQDDTAINFKSTQNPKTGETTFKSINVRGASPVRIKIASCDIVLITLRTNNEPVISYTAQITPSLVMLEVCSPECHEEGTITIVDADCRAEQTYTMAWSTTYGNTTHTFEVGSGGDLDFNITDQIDYDVMFVTALSETAEFVLELPEKDCSKIKSGDEADNFGVKFVVPVAVSDKRYIIFLTNANNVAVNVSLLGDQGNIIRTKIVGPKETVKTKKKNLNGSNEVIKIEASGEISVYVLRNHSSGKTFGHPVLPFDILGPSYQVFLDRTFDTDVTNDNKILCTSLAITENTHTESNVGPVPVDINKGMYNDELGHQKLFTANRPIAMFCGGDDSRVQMPPRETLGKQHYIPPLTIYQDEVADIRLVATEDSTVVIIRGDYDHLETVEFTGNIHTLTAVTDMLYNISSTKPIQVHLQIQSKKWTSIVVIPPVEQYKSKHVFPNVFRNLGRYRTAVYENGSFFRTDTVLSEIQNAGQNINESVYERKAFSLTVLQYPNFKLIIPSDVTFNDINKVCKITPGTPGDGKDNDCDGLTDEEQCSDDIVSSVIDADVDGSLNEDCANGTTPPNVSAINLLLTSTLNTCPANKESGTGNKDSDILTDGKNGDVTIDNGMQKELTSLTIAQPNKATVFGSGPSYTPLANIGGSIPLPDTPTTTAAAGSTADPVETCTVDCACPCSWVDPPKNYTAEELKAVIVAIKEKLKVKKSTLSATIRSKSSAKDNRMEAAAIGIVGVAWLTVMFGAVFLLDLTAIARDVRMFIGNLRQVFQP